VHEQYVRPKKWTCVCVCVCVCERARGRKSKCEYVLCVRIRIVLYFTPRSKETYVLSKETYILSNVFLLSLTVMLAFAIPTAQCVAARCSVLQYATVYHSHYCSPHQPKSFVVAATFAQRQSESLLDASLRMTHDS